MPGYDDGYVRTMYMYHTINFPRNVNGNLDVSNGKYSREKFTLTKCKCTEKVLLYLGVAVVTTITNAVEKPQ